jgi:protein-tyrosine phosphatase
VVLAVWDQAAPGVCRLPSGRLVRGRGLALPSPGGALPEFGIYLLDEEPPPVTWESVWVPWPDFGLPADPVVFRSALARAWRHCATRRVELACLGGNGRTGTALACLAILDGIPASAAVDYVRAHYRPTAIETPDQEKFVRDFG